jgi:phosphoserine phosphatase RsbU/P
MAIDYASDQVERTLQCMEIWGGIEPVERAVATPGLDLWVYSQPYAGQREGGDVHYVTLCGGGVITRVVVADVSGHGTSAAEFSGSLRTLLRKNINHKSQKRLVERLNRQFTEMARLRRFATAVVVTYLASTDRLSVCNAGHPRPLLYRAALREWSLLAQKPDDLAAAANLPLGLDEETRYQAFDVELDRGDLVVFYTDGLSEAADQAGCMLGETGLLRALQELDISDHQPARIGTVLLREAARRRGGGPAEDDLTVVVLYHNGSASPRLSLGQKLDVYAKFFGLKAY